MASLRSASPQGPSSHEPEVSDGPDFFEDPLDMLLKERLRAYLEQLQTITGRSLFLALMPGRPPRHWPKGARVLLEASQLMSSEFHELILGAKASDSTVS